MVVSFELIEQFLDKEGNPVFQTEVRIEGLPGGAGNGYSKKESQQNAAQIALKKIKSDSAFIERVYEIKAQNTLINEESSSEEIISNETSEQENSQEAV